MSTPAPVALTLADLDPTQPMIAKPSSGPATLVADTWQALDTEAAEQWCEQALCAGGIKGAADITQSSTPALPEGAALPNVLLPLAVWLAQRDASPTQQAALHTLAQAGRVGVWLSPDENPEALQAELALLPIIGFFFPHMKYGQAYSHAVLLRTRYGFKGQLRAFGDVGRDQLFYLARCGFTQFKIKPGKCAKDALQSFADFSTPYQTSADGQPPIFVRRGAAA